MKFTYLKWLKMHSNYSLRLEKILKYDYLKWLKIHANCPTNPQLRPQVDSNPSYPISSVLHYITKLDLVGTPSLERVSPGIIVVIG